MRNLLNESFSRLFKSNVFYVCFIIIMAFPTLIIGLEKILIKIYSHNEQYYETASTISGADCIFLTISLLPLIVAIAAGLFIAKDFRQNTVRNKIICGYSRTAIYMTNWITTSFVMLFYHFATMIWSVLLGSILFTPGDIFTKINIYYVLISVPTLLSFSSITVMMTMMLKNTAGAIFSYFIHQFLGIFELILYYIDNKSLVKFIHQFLPMNQLSLIQAMNLNYDDFMSEVSLPSGFDAVALPLYALILIVAVTAVGILHFKKSDIK